jgi:hypothetical protein
MKSIKFRKWLVLPRDLAMQIATMGKDDCQECDKMIEELNQYRRDVIANKKEDKEKKQALYNRLTDFEEITGITLHQ